MIDYATTKPGDKLRITGMGAPGFAELGDIVTVTKCNGDNKLFAKNDAGTEVFFALTCGAQRLEHTNE
ncbi:MAG TPA: hypothetical protein DEB52_16985 [Hyphomonas sp.]|jgi:hypothetical protein|nr:hypothetical protein [Hyphomonas sp.]HBT37630.1 hypothetical protein [Hyphomonas sp.]|tara:strand:- start:3426 stop:3629 length:204 start_codon:yes stop_codon:yes gene_type:complete